MSVTTATEYYERLKPLHYEPLWRIHGVLTAEPTTAMVPYLWRYAEIRSLIMEAGDLITAEEASRRVLAFKNPGTAAHEVARATDLLWAAIQLVLPGESAPAHRHTPAALRFVIEGSGGFTTVDGEHHDMRPGDLILTPTWSWHAHGHAGEAPMLWIDGLDLPLAHSLHSVFAEFPEPGAALPVAPVTGPAPTHRFPFVDMQAALNARRDAAGDPYDDIVVEYRDPITGGPVLPTIAAAMQLLRPGIRTDAHRHTHSVVYHVVAGSGSSTINGRRFDWTKGDTFVIPTWVPHQHTNPGAADALLFSFTDAPVLDVLGLARSVPAESPTDEEPT